MCNTPAAEAPGTAQGPNPTPIVRNTSTDTVTASDIPLGTVTGRGSRQGALPGSAAGGATGTPVAQPPRDIQPGATVTQAREGASKSATKSGTAGVVDDGHAEGGPKGVLLSEGPSPKRAKEERGLFESVHVTLVSKIAVSGVNTYIQFLLFSTTSTIQYCSTVVRYWSLALWHLLTLASS